MSTFACPQLTAAHLSSALEQMGVARLKPEHIESPTPDILRRFYSDFLMYIDPLGEDPEEHMEEFSELKFLENHPENYRTAFAAHNLFREVREVLEWIGFEGFQLRDMMCPVPKRTSQILSAIVNFLFHREDKLNSIKLITDQFPACEEQRIELVEKINELNRKALEHEAACQRDEPVVQELHAEVQQLKQTIHSYNSQYAESKTEFEKLKTKCQAIKEKMSHADFELSEVAQENSKLLSKIVQSPHKLQKSLGEKRLKQVDSKNSERAAMQQVHKKTAILEAHSKASEKMSKHLPRMQNIQEQANSNKAVDKDVKALKATLSNQEVSNISIESKIVEMKGKEKQLEQLAKALEKDSNARHVQSAQKLDAVRAEVKRKLQLLEPKESEAEAMISKAEGFALEAETVRAAGKAQQRSLQAKFDEIMNAFGTYSNQINGCLEIADAASEDSSVGREEIEQHCVGVGC